MNYCDNNLGVVGNVHMLIHSYLFIWPTHSFLMPTLLLKISNNLVFLSLTILIGPDMPSTKYIFIWYILIGGVFSIFILSITQTL